MRTNLLRGVWALLCSSLLSCSRPADDGDVLVDQMLTMLARNEGGMLRVATATSFDWDQMFVFGPYTTADHVASTTGVGKDAIESTGIEARDDISLLVFLEGGRLAKLVACPRGKLDFADANADRGLSPQQAVFVGVVSEGVPRLRLAEQSG